MTFRFAFGVAFVAAVHCGCPLMMSARVSPNWQNWLPAAS